jgi:hypothetical protein
MSDHAAYRRPAAPPPHDLEWFQKTLVDVTETGYGLSIARWYITLIWDWTVSGFSSPPGVTGYRVYYSNSTGTGGPWTLAATRTADQLYYLGYSSDSVSVMTRIAIPSSARAVKIETIISGTWPDLDTVLYGDLDLS